MTLDAKYLAILISAIIAVCGWIFSSYINDRAFRRAEASKLKDKISSQIELFFNELEEKLKIRTLKESELDDYITGKMTIIELQIKHLLKKINISLVSPEKLMLIRNEPFNMILISNGDYKKNFNELKFSTLEELEENYTLWYFSQDQYFMKKITNIIKDKIF